MLVLECCVDWENLTWTAPKCMAQSSTSNFAIPGEDLIFLGRKNWWIDGFLKVHCGRSKPELQTKRGIKRMILRNRVKKMKKTFKASDGFKGSLGGLKTHLKQNISALAVWYRVFIFTIESRVGPLAALLCSPCRQLIWLPTNQCS